MIEVEGDLKTVLEVWSADFPLDRTQGHRPYTVFRTEVLYFRIMDPDWSLTFRELT